MNNMKFFSEFLKLITILMYCTWKPNIFKTKRSLKKYVFTISSWIVIWELSPWKIFVSFFLHLRLSFSNMYLLNFPFEMFIYSARE